MYITNVFSCFHVDFSRELPLMFKQTGMNFVGYKC